MIPIDSRSHIGERSGESKLLEIPRLLGSELQAFGVDYAFERLLGQEEPSGEAAAGRERQGNGFSGGRRQGDQSGEGGDSGRLWNLVVVQLGIAEIERTRERARGLRKHLEAFAI